LTDNNKGNVQKLSDNYLLITSLRKVAKTLGQEPLFLSTDNPRKPTRSIPKNFDCPEVLCVVDFFQQLFSELAEESYRFFLPDVLVVSPKKPPARSFYPQKRFFCDDPNSRLLSKLTALETRIKSHKYEPNFVSFLKDSGILLQ
jgi:hypothetical protein